MALIAAAALSGCATAPVLDPRTDGAPGDSGDLLIDRYPAGPYRTDVGGVVPDVAWAGYVDPAADEIATRKPWGDYSLDAMRRSGRRYGLVYLSDDW